MLCPLTVIAPGCIRRVTVEVGFFNVVVYPVPNYDISQNQMREFEDSITGDIRLSKESPMSNFVLVLGDFNLVRKDSHRISLPNPSSSGSVGDLSPENVLLATARARRWQGIFDSLTEVWSPPPTHYCAPQLFLNQIERTFTSAPRSSFCLFKQRSGVNKSPIDLYVQGLSDHAPVLWSVNVCNSVPQDQQRLLPEFCHHHVFCLSSVLRNFLWWRNYANLISQTRMS